MALENDLTFTLTEQQVLLLQRAAAVAHLPVDEFARDATLAAAQDVVLDQVLFRVTADEMKAFEEILERPCVQIPQMVRLLNQAAPWDEISAK